MKKFILFLSVVYGSNLAGQSVRNPQTGIFARTGSYSSDANVSSFNGNQASLSGLKKFSAAVATERRFMLGEIGLQSLAVAIPTSGGNFALGLRYFGGTAYSEMFSSFTYARRMGKIDAGVQFNYFLAKTVGYSLQSLVNFELGLMFHPTDQVHTGVHVYNPVVSRKTKARSQQFPTIYSAGIGYDISENFFAGFIVEKETFYPVSVDIGAKYVFGKTIFARIGLRSGTSVFSFGTGVEFESFQFEVLASMHPQLGITPALMIIYKPSDKQ